MTARKPEATPVSRTLRKDGSYNIERRGMPRRRFAQDVYHHLLNLKWRWLIAYIATLYMSVNALFALLYLGLGHAISNARPGSFEDAFFFSVQTLATIGYGSMAPMTRYAHTVVTIESILGILAVGSLAGVSFARLSRPKARVLFSDRIVVRPRNGVPHMQFRIANWRTNLIVEAGLKVYLLMAQRTTEGEVQRVPVELKLVRPFSPVFFLTWTVMHAVDETSPFFGEDAIAKLKSSGAELFASLTGYDQTLGQIVHAYTEYKLDEIVHNAKFADIVTLHPDGRRELDFSRFHEVVPLESAS